MAESENKDNYREDEIDAQYERRLNPYGLSRQELETGKQSDRDRAFETKQYNATHDGSSSDQIRSREEAALTSGLYTGSGRSEQNETVSLKTVLKKKGPLGALIALGLGIPTLLTIMLSPALLLQQLSETMTGAFNDQLAALDARSTLLLKKKLNSTITKGMCGKVVTIKCKYQSIRKNSGLAKRLDKAGVKVIGDDSIIPGRVKPTHFEFEGNRIAAKDLLNEARKNPALRSALRKGYDPLYAAFSDKISTKVRTKLGIKRSSSVSSSSDQKKMNEDLKKVASGDLDLPDKKLKPIKNGDGEITGYVDEDSGKVYPKDEGARLNGLIDELADRAKIAESVTKAGVKAGIKSALTATALGAGAVDSVCTAWVLLRVASFAAKVYQQRQLIRYGYEFMKVAHKQKYGDLTAEEAEFYGNKLTSINSEGKGAFDSAGYKFAAYGDTFSPGEFNVSVDSRSDDAAINKETERIALQNETSRYVNGQLLTDNIMSKLVGAITKTGSGTVEKADDICGFVKSWKGQAIVIGAAILGAVVGFFSGGASIGWGALANAAAMGAVSVAFALVQPKLLDMVKGEVIKGDENGPETGNAVTSSAGGYNAHASPGRGLGVSTQDTYTEYASLTEQVLAKNAEIDRSELSPFDATNKNTFLGSLVSNILPFTTKMSSLGSTSLATSSFISSSFASLGMKQAAYAAGAGDRFNKCEDHEYKGLAADPFCNLRYAIPKADLKIDPDVVLDFMLSKYDLVYDSDGNPVIDPDTGEQKKIYHWIESPSDATPKGDYAAYIERCFNREDSIGDPGSSEGKGTECIIGKGGSDEERNKMFRLFYIDTSAYDGLDEDFESDGTGEEATVSGDLNLTIATFNIFHSDKQAAEVWQGRLEKSIKVITENSVGVAGLQEARPDQQRELMKADRLGGTYGIFPKTTERPTFTPNPIIWDTSKYTLVDNGTEKFDIEYDNGGKIAHGVQVKLKDNSTGAMFYVLNTHDPANVRPGTDATNSQSRADNAKTYVDRTKQLSSEGLPVFLTGDFNSLYNAGPHCTISSSGIIKDTWELYKNIRGCAKNRPLGSEIDRIYTSKQGTVEKMWAAEKGPNNNGSDHHSTIMANVSFTGSGEGSSSEVTWPLDKKWWTAKKLDYLNSHGSTGTAWGEDNMGTSGKGAYIATDIGVPEGTPVYAMVGGTVTSTSLCGSNDGIAIKSDIGGKTLGIAYMHGKNKKFSKGDTVKAGDYIMDVGTLGCTVYGAHLHIGMAYTGSYICPQDVFLALEKNEPVNWGTLPEKASRGCGRL